jgi:predicted amidohydrolase
MKVTLVQFSPKLSRKNLDTLCDIVKEYRYLSDLIVFPELALSGYLLQDKLYEDAWDLDELQPLIELSNDVDIVVGVALRDKKRFTNSALYLCGGKLISKHDKVHLPNYGMFEEARYFKSGTLFESFTATFGKTSMLVCEDLWHKSVHKELMQENPNLIVALVASPARGFVDDGLEIEKKWYAILKVLAKECSSKLIFVNRVGFEDGLGFWGGSCVVAKNGDIVKQLPKFKFIVKNLDLNI